MREGREGRKGGKGGKGEREGEREGRKGEISTNLRLHCETKENRQTAGVH